jgi:radical SAM protein with 4Fe4S-binding SPASM domain
MLVQNIKKIIYSDFVELNLPFIPRLLAKYDSYSEDFKSLFCYYILRKRNSFEPKLNGLIIIPTTICNANCVFCANRYLKDKRGIMPLEMFKRVVDEYKDLGGKSVSITPTLGDIFTDSGIFDKLDYLDKKGISFSFYTNAILLDRYIDKVLESGIKMLYVDIADIIPKFDSKVFQISEELSKKRLDTIALLLKEADKKRIDLKIVFSFRSMRSPKEIYRDFSKSIFFDYYKRGRLIISFLQVYDNWGGLISKKDLVGIQGLKRAPKVKKYYCQALNNISVLPNGDLRLCGCRCLCTLNDELVIGNIKKDSLKNITKNKNWKKILKDFSKKAPKVCNGCSFYRPLVYG